MLDDNLMLFYTGISRFSAQVQSDTVKAIGKKEKQAQLREMLTMVDDAEQILVDKERSIHDFGRLLHETWSLKRGISAGISTDGIDVLYEKARSAGALGGKLLGAGGGGFLLFYVEKEKQEAVRKALSELLYVPFGFENGGSRVIYYAPEVYEMDGSARD